MRDTQTLGIGEIVRYTSPTGYRTDAIVRSRCDDDGQVLVEYHPEGRWIIRRAWVPADTLTVPVS